MLVFTTGGAFAISAFSARQAVAIPSFFGHQKTFDIQGHRGGRGETVESTLASFAWFVHCLPLNFFSSCIHQGFDQRCEDS